MIGSHRADLVTADGWVVELQHSSISPEEIATREEFYGQRMLWLFDATEPARENRIAYRKSEPAAGGRRYVTFRWYYPRKTLAWCNRRVLLDVGGGHLLSLRRIYPNGQCGGWGYLLPADRFRDWISR